MLLQAGTLILYLLTTQVTDTLGQSETDQILRQVSLISHQLNVSDDKLNGLKRQGDLILKRLSEAALNSPLDETSCIKGQPHQNGTNRFTLWGTTPALCDTTTDGGEWVIIQKRVNGDTDFYRGWDEYKNFFGDLNTNFWMGNDAINRLTSEGYRKLRIDLIYQDKPYYAHYSNFAVANESMNYQLSVSGYSGTAGDSLRYHNNMYFSTFDRKNNKRNINCAEEYKGAWWYKYCYHSNLNGLWGSQTYSGLVWKTITGTNQTVSFSEMKLRRG